MELQELRKLQKIEVLKRLKILNEQYKLNNEIIENFSKNETIYISEEIENEYMRNITTFDR